MSALHRCGSFALAAGVWLCGSTAAAQTVPPAPAPLSLEQFMDVEIPSVVGASRFAQQVVDAPASVTIVTSDEIERFGYRTFADILRGVRGFYVNYDRNYSYVGARGFLRPGDYNSRILLLLDGHRLNDNIYDQASIGTEFPLDIELIDRVEIVRGPSSSLYGTSAFFAVVNVLTRRGSQARSEAALIAGSQATTDGRAVLAHRFDGGGELQLSASRYDSHGMTAVPVDDAGLASADLDQDRATRLFGTYTKGRWSALGLYATRTKSIPTGAYGVSLSEPSDTVDARGIFDLQYEAAVRGTSVLWRGSYDWYDYDGLYADGDVRGTLNDFAYGKWWGTELTATRRLQKHLFTTGAELRHNVQQDQGGYYADAPDDRVLDDRRTSAQWALYGQDEFRVSRKVIVNAGIRYDRWPTFGGTTNPRVGLILKPLPSASLKLLHGTAFRAPNLYELYYYGAFTELRPERIRTTELAWEQHLPGPWRLTLSGFHYRIRDLISQVAIPGVLEDIGFANIGLTDAAGGEAELERTWHHVQMQGSYTFTATDNHHGGEPLSNSPRHLGLARVTMPLAGRQGTLGMEWAYTSERRTITGGTTSGFTVGNFTVVSRELAGRLKLSFDLHNLLDRNYSDPGGEEHLGPIRQDGRTARAKLTWRF